MRTSIKRPKLVHSSNHTTHFLLTLIPAKIPIQSHKSIAKNGDYTAHFQQQKQHTAYSLAILQLPGHLLGGLFWRWPF